MKLYEEYPKIVATSPLLTWSHFTHLVAIPDKAKRKEYENEIIDKKLSIKDFSALIKKDNGLLDAKQSEKPLIPKRDKPFKFYQTL
jgi:hypothetical protein